MGDIRKQIIDGMIAHNKGKIAKHKANVEIYLNQSVGIGEHGDVLETIEKELNAMGKCHEQLEMINMYFADKTPKI
tara:strand:+ start:656 stop:883 length:228 start_codon:yes stop_codon:yes gene_type:complete